MKYPRSLLVVVPLVILLVAVGVSAQQGGDERVFTRGQLRAAIAVQEQYTDSLMLVSSRVVGTAVTADASGRGIVLVYVSSTAVPGIPTRLDGVTVRVEAIGELVALKGKGKPGSGGDDGDNVDPTSRFDRPVPIGVSTGHPDITAGTIGARVTDGTDVYALSNNHVYANLNAANPGILDPLGGDSVIQPGTFDDGSSPADDIGTLWDFGPIVFCEAYPDCSVDNVIDAAIALSSTVALGNATPSDGYGTPKSTTILAAVNMRVMKYGRTTGQTKGRISAINATVNVGYGGGNVARFINQIVVGGGGFSAGGDSGSLVVGQKNGDERKPVGLLYAGSSSVTILNPIDAVLTAFDVTIDGS
ncbi:MAG: hypothetical protein IH849_11495 [Acidobacteria bacterium]|nr:hypothetical protein [Acidobacteriota bacterium]